MKNVNLSSYIHSIAEIECDVNALLHSVIMIHNVEQFVSMRLVGLAPTLLPTLLKSRLVCVNHVPNHSRFL